MKTNKVINAIGLSFCCIFLVSHFSKPKEYSLQKLYNEKASGVIQLVSQYDSEKKTSIIHTGAGFFISSTGLIATAAHVIHRMPFDLNVKMIAVLDDSGKQAYEVTVKKVDLEHDVALLQIVGHLKSADKSIPKCKFLKINPRTDYVVGTHLVTIGNPSALFRVMSEGILSSDKAQSVALGEDVAVYHDLAISTLLIYPGNSGGPVFNMYGEVVGVVTMGNMDEKLAFLQKIKYVQRLVDDRSNLIVVYKEKHNEKSLS